MAAGLGFKTFNTGDVLTAADVNGYLMQGVLVFADATARDAAITSPQEGQFAYTKDNNSLWYYTGSAWAASGATGDIEGVTAGTGISGGGTSGTVTITNSMATAIDAKGDLIVGTGADTFDRLAVGTNGHTLVADSAQSTGLKWAAPSAATFVGVSVDSTIGLTIANATSTAVAFDNEIFDTDGFHSTSTNNSRLTVPSGKAGYYHISAYGYFSRNATGMRSLAIYKNGSLERYFYEVAGSSSYYFAVSASATLYLAVGDYIQFYVYQNSGGNLDYRPNTANNKEGNHEMVYLGA